MIGVSQRLVNCLRKALSDRAFLRVSFAAGGRNVRQRDCCRIQEKIPIKAGNVVELVLGDTNQEELTGRI